jgi:hypothetical protein
MSQRKSGLIRQKGANMSTVTIQQINERLKSLPDDKLVVIFDFISYLAERELNENLLDTASNTIDCMYASEEVLARDWNLPAEDEAWASL